MPSPERLTWLFFFSSNVRALCKELSQRGYVEQNARDACSRPPASVHFRSHISLARVDTWLQSHPAHTSARPQLAFLICNVFDMFTTIFSYSVLRLSCATVST